MKRKYQVIRKGEFRELDEKSYHQLIYSFHLAKVDYTETIEKRFSKNEEIVIQTISAI